MADIASLVIRVTTNGVDGASASLGKLGKAALAAGTAIGGLETARQVFNSLVASQRNFDKLNSGLITMTGSAENAAKAFQVLQQFAKETPYGLNQAVEGFTKLVALGLDPSKEALISYGNTAAAMGKDLNQMIEAVADAATGEFERLKEFGIKASQNGDQVSFTFRGVTTTVKKSSEEIQKYLLNIGNTDFAGAMDVRAKTLDGVLSSLADTFDGLVLNIAQSGFGDAVAEQAQKAEDAIQSLSDSIASGELIGAVEDWVTLFEESFKFVSDALNDLAFDTEGKSSDMAKSLGDIPDAIREWLPDIQQTFHEVVAWFQRLDDYAVALGQSFADVFDVSKSAGLTFKNMTAEADKAYAASLASAKAEADGIRQRSEARRKEIEEQRKQYEERRKQEIDLRTLVNKPGTSGGASSGAGGSGSAAATAKRQAEQQRKQAQEFIDGIKRQNSDELAAIDEKERQKLAKLDEFRKQNALKDGEYEATKTQIALDADAQRNELLKQQTEARMKEQNSADEYIKQLQANFEGEAAELDRQYAVKQEKLDEFHKKGLVSEEEYLNAKAELQKQKDEETLRMDLNTWDQIAGNIASASKEGTAIYKAAAITQSIISTYLAATKALAEGGPILGPILAATTVAAGLANVAKIRSAREQGGSLSAGQASTIAERGKPEVIMPASASRVRTAQQMRQIMGESGSKQNNNDSVVIVNQTTGRIDQATTERDDEGRLRILIRETVSSDMQDSNSQISLSRRNTRNQPGF
ncbi:tail tape measure protein [Klebsiella phage 37P2]|nr:tail tape measure protein [Klebsiella phage 37P2]